MHVRTKLLWLYLVNAAVLITHEIDAAYWHEWDLFGIPGGIQVFLALNLVLVLAVLYGLLALALGRRSGVVWSWVLVAGGFFAAFIHTYFLVRGSDAFRLPVSVAILGTTFVLSTAQGLALLRARGRTSGET